jgi:uncharacterized membrane protein
MDGMNLLESLFRWIHVVAGILWIGLLYFFNWVNSAFAPTMDAETKKKVIPELIPRTLYWFRWGAAFTWVTGVLLLLLVYYHTGLLFETGHWGVMTFIMLAIVFFGVFIYDALVNGPLKEPMATFIGGLVLAFVVLALMDWVAGFSFRGYAIHLGALFGTIMAFNVWFRIWPAQQKIITATKEGTAPDAALVALAGTRSKQPARHLGSEPDLPHPHRGRRLGHHVPHLRPRQEGPGVLSRGATSAPDRFSRGRDVLPDAAASGLLR